MTKFLALFQSPKIWSVVSNETLKVIDANRVETGFQSPKIGSVVSNHEQWMGHRSTCPRSCFNPLKSGQLFQIRSTGIAVATTVEVVFQSPKIGSVVSNMANLIDLLLNPV